MSKKKRSYCQPVSQEIWKMRFEIARKNNFIDDNVFGEDWWDKLTNMQKSQVNGYVTKLLIAKAQVDLAGGRKIY